MKILYTKECLKEIENHVDIYLNNINKLFDNKLEFDIQKNFDNINLEIIKVGVRKYGNTVVNSDTIMCIEFDEFCDLGLRVKYSDEIGYYLDDEDEYCSETDDLLIGIYNAQQGERCSIDKMDLSLDIFAVSLYSDLLDCYDITSEIDDMGISDLLILPKWTKAQLYEKIYKIWEDNGVNYFPAEDVYTEKTDTGLYSVMIRYEWKTDKDGNRHVEAVEVDRRPRIIRR